VVIVSRLEVTQRDLELLRWVGEMYAVPMSLLARLVTYHGVSDASAPVVARREAARLARPGYAVRQPLLGRRWIVPTRAGLRFADLPYHRWEPVGWTLGHVEAVARLRLHFQGTLGPGTHDNPSFGAPMASWISERAIRHRWHGQGVRVRIADGGILRHDGTAIGVEYEEHIKPLHRYQSAVADVDPEWSEVWWVTPPQQVELLTKRLIDAGDPDPKVLPSPLGTVAE
jgi:hypothetical protein